MKNEIILFENQNVEEENVQPDPSMEKNIESSSDENLNKLKKINQNCLIPCFKVI